MMMTCRLLCALLVLALCCCPSVCAISESVGDVKLSCVSRIQLSPTDDTTWCSGNAFHESSITDDRCVRPDNATVDGKSVEGIRTKTQHVQGKMRYGRTKVRNAFATRQIKVRTCQTTTTIRQRHQLRPPPLRTEHQPPHTTTEAPTTTTTRAPSLLREIDGSLSSSAWVCFPLLLAASALAYTAVG
ncbi:mucin TcMUCII [Trypanosoma cruzi cruzi]|nr:mucin TcMUCII [Trypanosoma cruzi cruzi]